MKTSNLLSVLVAVALVFANATCACASVDSGDASQTHAHHHADNGHQPTSPCTHTDCDGCASIDTRCFAAGSDAISVERDYRHGVAAKLPDDSPDWQADVERWQAPALPPRSTRFLAVMSAAPSPVADTPVVRKDRLIE